MGAGTALFPSAASCLFFFFLVLHRALRAIHTREKEKKTTIEAAMFFAFALQTQTRNSLKQHTWLSRVTTMTMPVFFFFGMKASFLTVLFFLIVSSFFQSHSSLSTCLFFFFFSLLLSLVLLMSIIAAPKPSADFLSSLSFFFFLLAAFK